VLFFAALLIAVVLLAHHRVLVTALLFICVASSPFRSPRISLSRAILMRRVANDRPLHRRATAPACAWRWSGSVGLDESDDEVMVVADGRGGFYPAII
jgi:hypothetical protein